jgi:hypothetical protein
MPKIDPSKLLHKKLGLFDATHTAELRPMEFVYCASVIVWSSIVGLGEKFVIVYWYHCKVPAQYPSPDRK